jgi:Recombination endonuclease VII
MKRCTKCGVEQPFTNFYPATGTRDGLRGDCKGCFKARAAARYRANPEPAKERAKAWARANPERVVERARLYRLTGRKARNDRRSHLKRKFGITPEEYDRMLAEQGGRCAICRRRPTTGISLHVDHEHRTKRVRGLLCFRCNNALGDFRDRADFLVNALHYLDPPPTAATRRRIDALVPTGSR